MNRYDDRGSGRRDREREDWYRDDAAPRGEWRDDESSRQWRGNESASGEWRNDESGSGDWRSGRGWERDSGSRERDSASPYGQRDPYNIRGTSRRARLSSPWDERGSRYSESQYSMRRDRPEGYGSSRHGGPRHYDEPQLGERPFDDPHDSPGYFGTGYYGDGGSTYTGGFDQRSHSRYPGALAEDTLSSSGGRPRRFRSGPKGYVRSDERIREDISERLMMADSIDSSEVSVSVTNGRVMLEGTVPTRSVKHAIEDLADYTAGVQDVENRIRVERAGAAASSSGIQTASGITPTSGSGRSTKQ